MITMALMSKGGAAETLQSIKCWSQKREYQHPGKTPSMVTYTCNSSTGETGTNRSLGLTSQAAYLNW